MPELKQSVLDLLQDFRGLHPLKDLFWSELNYERVNQPLSRGSWNAPSRDALAEDPLLFASAANGEFHVVYARLASDDLQVGNERPVIAQLLRDHPYALFVFSNRAQDRWHFVNVKVAAGRDTADNRDPQKRRLFRRLTIASGERLRTAAERLSMLDVEAAAPNLLGASALALQAQHDEAFDVEAVTKAFYRQYREVFQQVEASIRGLGSDAERKRLFTQRLFNRLMFIAFIQKKGWLRFKDNTEYLEVLWRDYQNHRDEEENENFYRDRLQLLFFTGLNGAGETDVIGINRGGVLKEMIGEVPYLNGGLFEQDELDQVSGVVVPDTAIASILRDLFARFNFTVTESTPLDVEVAVDPEMLGKVFEELVTGRHESGSYYTPKPIVSFMCREALKGYLQTAVPRESAGAIGSFVEEHHPTALRNPEAVLEALREIKICDPACGSGAYLLGMLHELLELRASLFAVRQLDPVSTYDRKLEIIQNNLYGVDIDVFAINIARLRLWLSLAVDFEGDRPEPLPNLDFKIEQGDSLAAPLPDQQAFRDELIHKFRAAKADFMRAHHGQKREAKKRVEELRREITSWTHAGRPIEGFDWGVEFAEVFLERHASATIGGEMNLGQEMAAPSTPGGFDVVLANPPYVRMELFKEQKPTLRRNFPNVHSDRADLYVYFYGRALELLAPGGMLVFISSNKWFRAGYGTKLREHIGQTCQIWSITDFRDLPVFESATAYPMIFVAQKQNAVGRAGGPGALYTEVESLDAPYPDVSALIREKGARVPASTVRGADWRLTNAAAGARIDGMQRRSVPLKDYVRGEIFYGIKTGLNEAFIISDAERDQLLRRDPRNAEVIKPFVNGRAIQRWAVERDRTWLLYMHHGISGSRYHSVLEHLRPFKERLEKRATRQEWYELQQPQFKYATQFIAPKIVFPDIAKIPRFALDNSGAFIGDTAFALITNDLYLLGVLNSQAVADFFIEVGASIRGGYLRFKRQYVEQIPIPRCTPTDRHAIGNLVQECANASGKGAKVKEWEAEINDRVAVLYGLKEIPERVPAGV